MDVVAVMGACAPERQQYAERLAAASGRMLIPAKRLALAADPNSEAVTLAPWAGRDTGAVAEFPSTSSAIEVIGSLTDEEAPTRLTGIACVVDALHVLDDLAADDYIATERDALGRVLDCAARASLTVTQMECASMILLVSWEPLPTPELSTVMSLVSHLAPHARLRLQRDDLTPESEHRFYEPGQDRAGWVGLLN